MKTVADYRIVRSAEIEDEELPEIHHHNDVDQPAIPLQDLPSGTDHSTLSNVTIDQHHARDHATRHLSGGGDALTLTASEVPTSAWAADIIPALDSAYDLGSTTKAWANLYVDTIKSITGNPLALTPVAGQNLTVNLSTTGDLIVNTDDLVVDTSSGNVGIGTTGPSALFSVAEKLLVTSAGLASKYNNVNTTGWGVPAIYATGRSTAQSATVASVATYTVGASDGSFIVSANVLVTTSTTHDFTVTCAYTDEGNTARTLTFNFSSLAGVIATTIVNTGGTVPYQGVPMHIRCKAATSITIATTGTFTTVTYNVEGSIIQIA